MNAPAASHLSIPNSAVFDEVAAVVGSAAAVQLCKAFGGTTLYVPKALRDDHPIIAAIGREAAESLSRNFTGENLALPKMARRRAQVIALAQRGDLTQAQIALATDYSERHVNSILSESRDTRQLDMFAPTDTTQAK